MRHVPTIDRTIGARDRSLDSAQGRVDPCERWRAGRAKAAEEGA